MSHDSHEARYTTRVHADIERPDRVLAGLTARQVAILAGAAAILWAAFMATRHLVPPLAFLAFGVPVAATAVAFALVRRDGLSLDRFALAAIRQRLAPLRYVPGTVPDAPPFMAAHAGPAPAPLDLPVAGVRADGVIDLGAYGHAAVIACGTVSFALATGAEQESMVAGFARCLHGLSAPVQILVRAERIDLTPMASRVIEAAPYLPAPELETAAREHAAFLADLAARSELLWRQVSLIVREVPSEDPESTSVLRRAEHITAALTAAGISATVLDGPTAARVLAAACDPNNPAPFTGPLISEGAPR